MSATPKSMWPAAEAMLHSVYGQPDGPSAHAQFHRLLDYVSERLPAVAQHLEPARDDLLAFTNFPKDVWSQISSNEPTADSVSSPIPTPRRWTPDHSHSPPDEGNR